MKTYLEEWENPFNNKVENIEVHEYTFEDFANGTLIGKIEAGKMLLKNNKNGKFHYQYVPIEEAKKIQNKRKEYYFEKVEERFNLLKRVFEKKRLKSDDIESLIQTEIGNSKGSASPKSLYYKIIVEGNRDFNFTNSPNCQITLGNDFEFIKIEGLNKYHKWLKSQWETNRQSETKDYKNNLWFKVGLLFATGEMDKLIIQFQSNATQIAKHLKNKNCRPFISESISKTNENDKNIFSNQGKLLKIQKHCIENKIPMIDSFTKLIKPE